MYFLAQKDSIGSPSSFGFDVSHSIKSSRIDAILLIRSSDISRTERRIVSVLPSVDLAHNAQIALGDISNR